MLKPKDYGILERQTGSDMKYFFLILLAFAVYASAADPKFGFSAGGGIGMTTYYAEDIIDFGSVEGNLQLRAATILGEDQVFTIGIDYFFSAHSYTQEQEYSYYHSVTEEHSIYSNNIGISMGMNLNRNPVWWTIGYSIDSKGPFFMGNIGLLAGSKESNDGVLFNLFTYVSSTRIGFGTTILLHFFGDSYKRDEDYEYAGAIAGLCTSIAIIAAAGAVQSSKGDSGGSKNEDYPSCRKGCLCNDNTWSYAEHRQGACSWHGGISPRSPN